MLDRAAVEPRLLRSLVFGRPIRLVWPPSRAEHLPFAFWIVDALRPRSFVELGTHTGISYSGFAQAVQLLGLDTACYAIDPWTGDEHTGPDGESLYEEWSAFHARHFGSFSQLIRTTFDQARDQFADQSIDLLHIDGLQTYDGVRHDFETWLPKTTSRAVVLFNDITVREPGFGVWRLWDELRLAYPSFAFTHGRGLGVLAVGPDRAPDVAWLTSLAAADPDTSEAHRVFSTLGELWATHIQLDRARADISHGASGRARLQAEHDRLRMHALQGELSDLSATAAAAEAQVAAARVRRGAVQASLDARAHAEEALVTTLRLSSPAAEPPHASMSALRRRLRWSGLSAARLRRHPVESARAIAALAHPAFRRNIGLLGASGVFDERHYASHEAVRGIPVVRLREHFVRYGDRAGLSPHPLFDPGWYRSQNPDLPKDARPLFHYLRYGAGEGRDPHPLFDTDVYLGRVRELDPGVSPLSHFLRVGAAAGASPHVLFDVGYYLWQHPEVAAAGHNPLLHYLEMAHRDQLDPHPLFSTRYYLANNPDIGHLNPLVHFVVHGAAEGRAPHPLFDVRHYLHQRPDLHGAGANALTHFVHVAHAEDVDPHPLFDSSYYLEQAEGLGARGVNPLAHFVTGGWHLGLRPNPWFDPLWYAERWNIRGVNPLVHYASYGWREGLDPSPDFSIAAYLARHPDVAAAGVDPLVHYLQSQRHESPPRLAHGASPTPARVFRVAGTATAHGPRTIVVVSHVSPWPVRAGNEYRLQRLLRHLRQQGYRIVLVLAPLPNEPPGPDTFDRAVAEFGNVVLCQPSGEIRFSLRDCPDVLSGLQGQPVPAARLDDAGTKFADTDRAFCHDTVCAVVTALAGALGRVALLAEYIFMTRFFPSLGHDVLKIVDTIDVFSQKGSNVIAYGIEDAEVPARDEARRLERADVVVAIHEADAMALRALVPEREVLVSSVDADVDASRPWPDQPVVFVAGSSNPLNLAGMRDFLRFGWPGIRAGVPGAQLRVAGGIGAAVAPGTPGVAVLGHVPDLMTEYAGARVAINPTVAGTGLKIKTIEALAHLTPVVGWPHSRDGLSAGLLPFVHEARDWQDFADKVVRVLILTTCPFDAGAAAMIREQLSPDHAYRMLDDRLRRFFGRGDDGA